MTKIARAATAMAVVALLAVVGLAAPASAQQATTPGQYTGAVCTIVVTTNPPSLTIRCEGFPPGFDVRVFIDGVQVLSDGIVRPDGTIDVTLANQAGLTECRNHDIRVEAGGVSRTVNYTPPGCPAPPAAGVTPRTGGALPYTGSDSAPLLQIGVLLVAGGAAAVFFYRQRAKHNEA